MTKLSQLKIDPEFQRQINPPTFEEKHQLEMNILKEERVQNPIITWNGYIVDGYTRYQILRKYPFIPFEVIERKFSNRYEALAWICKNQLGRRNLTPEQKKFLIGKQAEAEKQIKSFHGNQYTLASESGLVQNEPDTQARLTVEGCCGTWNIRKLCLPCRAICKRCGSSGGSSTRSAGRNPEWKDPGNRP